MIQTVDEILSALLAQLDRVTDYESVGRGFESPTAHHEKPLLSLMTKEVFHLLDIVT